MPVKTVYWRRVCVTLTEKFIWNLQENSDSADPSDVAVEIENVRVVVRVRPMDKIEETAFCENIIKVDKLNRSVVVRKPNASPAEPPKTYYFDNIFGEDSSQVRTRN